MINQAAIDKLLVSGLDDWIMLLEVRNAVVGTPPFNEGEEEMEATIATIDAFVTAGFAEIGNLGPGKDEGFIAWQVPKGQALEKIRSEWRALQEPLGLNDVCWLCTTPEADAIARRMVDEWTSHGNAFPFDADVWIERDRYGMSEGRIAT